MQLTQLRSLYGTKERRTAQRLTLLLCAFCLLKLSSALVTTFTREVERTPRRTPRDKTIQNILVRSSHLPRRRDGYLYQSNPYQKVYDSSWLEGGYPIQSCWGCRFAADVIARTQFDTILDAGAGNGALVRLMRKHGKSAFGIELSAAVLEKECPDLIKLGFVEHGILTNLPYEDNSFDLVFSSDVLEHIDPAEAEKVVQELVRVSREHLFLSISLKGHTKKSAEDSSEAHRHTLLRPREWWHAIFEKHGAKVNKDLLWAMQEKDFSYHDEDVSDCRWEGNETDGGTYEVCIVNNTWLVGEREQKNVRRDRCITRQNGELEPWFFAFRKMRSSTV